MLLTTEKPILINKVEYKFETTLYLPQNPERKAEGGLRTKGFFKHNYKLVRSDMLNFSCLHSNLSSSHSTTQQWYICDSEGNPVKPAPDYIQLKILEYVKNSSLVSHISPSLSLSHLLPFRSDRSSLSELPLIGVITVVYNGEKYLEETIQSVINQTYPNIEYIIIDGGSNDRTLNIISKYEDYIDYWVSEPDKGIYDAMNKGIKLSCSNYLWFINSDDICLDIKNIFSNLPIGNFLEAHLFPIIIFGSNIKKIYRGYLTNPHQGILYNKTIFKQIGLYDTNYSLISDRIFYDLMKKKGVRFYVYPNFPIAKFREGGKSSLYYNKIIQKKEFKKYFIQERSIMAFYRFIKLSFTILLYKFLRGCCIKMYN